MNKKERISVNRIWFVIALTGYFALLVYLYYNQLLYPVTGRFESDTAIHVQFAVKDGYYHSLAAFIYILLYKLPFSEALTAIVLALVTIGSIKATEVLIRKVLKEYGESLPDALVYIISIFANFLMAFYVKAANRQHYIGYESPNMWHNSTYTFMRLFAILAVIAYLDVIKSYKDKIAFREWLLLTLLLSVTTGFKASFLTAFAPALCIKLIVDLIRKTRFKNVFILGTTVIPSMLVMLLQSIVLGGGDGSNGYVIAPFKALMLRGEHPKATLVLSVLFPLVVFLTHIKDFYKDRLYLWTLIFTFVAFTEVFLLAETGERELDGNFMWGYFISLFFLFLVSMIKSVRDFYYKKALGSKLSYAIFSVETAILLWHALTGFYYFGLLLTGVTYFA